MEYKDSLGCLLPRELAAAFGLPSPTSGVASRDIFSSSSDRADTVNSGSQTQKTKHADKSLRLGDKNSNVVTPPTVFNEHGV